MVRTRQTAMRMVRIGATPTAKSSCRGQGCGPSVSSPSTPSTPSTSSSKNKNFSGGNPIHPREIPVWQKEITCFFQVKNNAEGSTEQPTGDDQRPLVECEQSTRDGEPLDGDCNQPAGDGEPLARDYDKPDGDVTQPDESKRCDEESLYQSLWVEDVMMQPGPSSETRW